MLNNLMSADNVIIQLKPPTAVACMNLECTQIITSLARVHICMPLGSQRQYIYTIYVINTPSYFSAMILFRVCFQKSFKKYNTTQLPNQETVEKMVDQVTLHENQTAKKEKKG